MIIMIILHDSRGH